MPPNGYVFVHKTLKVIPSVLNHLSIVSEEYSDTQEFSFNEINHSNMKSMAKETI